MTWQGNFICELMLFSLSLIVVICHLSLARQAEARRQRFQELLQLLANRQKDEVGKIIVLFGKILMYTSRL